jgi:ABC-type transport system substrate-binding protein
MKRLDRRALFATGAAAALLAATGAGLAQHPQRGGTLRLAVPREDDLMSRVARGAVYNQLTEVAPDGVLRGELATGWRSDDAARLWSLDIRNDVAFHDGRLLSGADVVASLEAHAVRGELHLEALDDIFLSPEGAVVLSLREGNPHLPYRLADTGLVIAPEGAVAMPLASSVGSGLYEVERAREQHHFRAARRAHHFKGEQAGWFDTIELIVIPDCAVRAEALRDGFVDVATLPLPDGLRGRGSFRFHPSEGDMALAAAPHVMLPHRVSSRAPLDDHRIAERWWMA